MNSASLAAAAGWSGLTLACYLAARAFYRRWPRWWSMPLLVAPVLIVIALLASHTSFTRYHAATGWMVWPLGPAVSAFAIPVYDQRALIARRWRELLAGMVGGSVAALSSGWVLASLLGIDGWLRLTLLPRSISTPFAMDLSVSIGGVPELTATFVIITGVVGALLGELLMLRGPVESPLARGAMFGVAGHAAGTAHLLRLDPEAGAIAGLTMVLTGALNLVAAPLIVWAVGG